jgi:preprotein translocase subunit YajC
MDEDLILYGDEVITYTGKKGTVKQIMPNGLIGIKKDDGMYMYTYESNLTKLKEEKNKNGRTKH